MVSGVGFADRTWVAAALSEIHARRGPISFLLHGKGTSVDGWACRWASRAGIPCAIRHSRLLLATDLLLVFPGRGTANLVRLARERGVLIETA